MGLPTTANKMLLLASAFFLTLLQCSNAPQTSITPADCNTIETDAGVALDLVNRHCRDGYGFGLFRVADAHKLHIGNSSVLYLTLDVLHTECSVLSRRHWESREYSDTYCMDFGQCKITTYTSQLLKKSQLYGFNCTLSPVPPDLLECKDCPVKVEVLDVTEQHKNIAEKALEKFNGEEHTNYFNVDKVEKILKTTASCEGHILGFSIKETNCSKSTQQANQALECDFLDDWHAHVGFCKARIISDPDEPGGTDTSYEIYHPRQHDYGQRCRYSTLGQTHRHPHPHQHFGHGHRHRHHHRHRCPPSSQSRPKDPEHNHSFNEEHQDRHEGPAPPPPHCGGPHHHLPPPPHEGPHPLPQAEPQHPPSAPPSHDAPHHPPPSQEELHYLPSSPPHHDERYNPPCGPHHGPHCPPPPHGPHHPHPPPHRRPHWPSPPLHHAPPPGHPPHLYHHYYRHHCNKTSISGKYFPSQITGAVYRIPALNPDSLTPPTANFPELSQSNPHSFCLSYSRATLTPPALVKVFPSLAQV
ncbi:LOW QUALITY PROTEIN: histidine-rich glycoprotein [Morphnus guianensis]